jgi:hypothetical protein
MLRAVGVTPEQIVRVLELEQNERLASRREQNRINKRNQRLRHHVSADSADSADRAYIYSKNLSSSEESLTESESKARARARGKRSKVALPDNFEPDLKTRLHASVLGISDQNFNREHEHFCDSARAHDRRYADWPAAERNWMTNFASGKFNHNGGNGNGRKTTRQVGEQLVAKLRAREAEAERSGTVGDADVDGVSGQCSMFGGLFGDAGGNIVPISAHRRDDCGFADPRGAEGIEIIPPNGRAGF